MASNTQNAYQGMCRHGRARIRDNLIKHSSIDMHYNALPFRKWRYAALKYNVVMSANKQLPALLSAMNILREEVETIREELNPTLSPDTYAGFVRSVEGGKVCLENLGFNNNGNFNSRPDVGIDEVWVDLEIVVRDIEARIRKKETKTTPDQSMLEAPPSLLSMTTYQANESMDPPSSINTVGNSSPDTDRTMEYVSTEENSNLKVSSNNSEPLSNLSPESSISSLLRGSSLAGQDSIVCSGCNFSNASGRTVCSQCHEEFPLARQKPKIPPKKKWVCSSCTVTTMNGSDETHCRKCGKAKEQLKTHWKCARCDNKNDQYLEKCSVCEQKKTPRMKEKTSNQFPVGGDLPSNYQNVKGSSKIDENEINENFTSGLVYKIRTLESMTFPCDLQIIVETAQAQPYPVHPDKLTMFATEDFPKKIRQMRTDVKDLYYNSYELKQEFSDDDIYAALGFCHGDEVRAVQKACETRYHDFLKIMEAMPDGYHHDEIRKAYSEATSQRAVYDYLNKLTLNPTCLTLPSPDKLVRLEGLKEKFLKKDINIDYRRHIALVEFSIPGDRFDTFINLIEDEDIIEAEHSLFTIRNAAIILNNFEGAKRYLLHKCHLCLDFFAKDKMESLMCGCECCAGCFIDWLSDCVNSKEVAYWNCPNGDHPLKETFLEYIAATVDSRPDLKDIRKKFHEKLNICGIMFEPNFRWCAHTCGNGFLYDQAGPKMQCPACRKFTCKECKKMWDTDHDNRTCEEFEAFKMANDPELAKALREVGVQCPKCKLRYEVARGGCMHFKCRMCTYEFCCGCYNEIFTKDGECPFKCIGKGLHSHHPRNCLYFLRDWEIHELESLLQMNNIQSVTAQVENRTQCSVKIVNENFEDFDCGKDVEQFNLCREHLKEYLVTKINQNNIEPIDKMPLNHVELVITREQLVPPPRVANEKDNAYLTRLRQHVKEQLPLQKLK